MQPARGSSERSLGRDPGLEAGFAPGRATKQTRAKQTRESSAVVNKGQRAWDCCSIRRAAGAAERRWPAAVRDPPANTIFIVLACLPRSIEYFFLTAIVVTLRAFGNLWPLKVSFAVLLWGAAFSDRILAKNIFKPCSEEKRRYGCCAAVAGSPICDEDHPHPRHDNSAVGMRGTNRRMAAYHHDWPSFPPSPRAWPVVLGAAGGPIGCALIFVWQGLIYASPRPKDATLPGTPFTMGPGRRAGPGWPGQWRYGRSKSKWENYAVGCRSRWCALRPKNSAWLATAETTASWNGLAIKNAGSGRCPVRKRSG